MTTRALKVSRRLADARRRCAERASWAEWQVLWGKVRVINRGQRSVNMLPEAATDEGLVGAR